MKRARSNNTIGSPTIGTKVKYVRGFQFWLTGILWIFPILFIAGVKIHIYSHNTYTSPCIMKHTSTLNPQNKVPTRVFY